jgi:poly(glycerol-phosphate) alpha-glucosyltransferase
MTEQQLPDGRYLTCTWDLSLRAGGMARALMMRHRMLDAMGHESAILSFVPIPDLEERREQLLHQGLVTPGVAVRSIYNHYREHDWGRAEPTGRSLATLTDEVLAEETRADGTAWRITYGSAHGGARVYDYLRDDGSTFLRIPAFRFSRPETWPSNILRVTREGEVLKPLTMRQWFQPWVRSQAGEGRSFIFLDARVLLPHLVPLRAAPRAHLLHVVHNVHTKPPHRWDSPLSATERIFLEKMDHLDAVVCLTPRQRDDIARRRGRTDNLFVVANPVTMPEAAAPVERDPRLVMVVSRLHQQKRLDHAISVFERVLGKVPDARLEIAGEGPERGRLQAMIDKRGLSHAITLPGFDPKAPDKLARASGFLMTSRYEGYPLATLESMSRGCPVVSYDIQYGPRDQITDGVDGYIVPVGDQEAMAERVVRLLSSPELVASMSAAAVEKARSHGFDRFQAEWVHVLQTVTQQRPTRISLGTVELQVTHLDVAPRTTLLDRVRRQPRGVPGWHGDDATLSFEGVLRVAGTRAKVLQHAQVELLAVGTRTGEVVELPLAVSRTGTTFTLRSECRLGELVGTRTADPVALHLRLVVRNCAWQTALTRPELRDTAIEAYYRPDGRLTIERTRASARGDG